MHPVIRIAAFLVAAIFLARGDPQVMMAVALGLSLAMFAVPVARWRNTLVLFRRLRWLLISLLFVYGWFTPGNPLWPALGAASPTDAGLGEGVLRCAALLLIALAAQLLMLATPRPQLLAALHWLAWPLSVVGVSRQRLAIRLTLTLEAVPQLSALMTPTLYHGLEGNTVERFGQLGARLFQGALDHATRHCGSTIEIITAQHPPLYQWVYPLSLGLLLAWVA